MSKVSKGDGANEKKAKKQPKVRTSPYEWNVDEVSAWIVSLGHTVQAKKFKSAMIDGSKLFQLDRTKLQNDVKIFDAKARNNILSEIKSLKQKIKQNRKKKVEKYAANHTRNSRKLKEKNFDDEKSKENIKDEMRNRTYIKANKNDNSSEIGSNYNVQNILEHFDFDKEVVLNESECFLKHCALNKDKKKSVFMFIVCNSTTNKHFYFLTKEVQQWTALNVFEFMRNVSNRKFVLVADAMKRKKVNGQKLLKYDSKLLRNDFKNNTDAAQRKLIIDEIKFLKKQMTNEVESVGSNKDQGPKKYHSPHKRTKSQIEADRIKRQKMKKAGPRDIGKIDYKGTKYDSSKDKAFLQDTVNFKARESQFQKRKEKNPAPKKETLDEIGKNTNFKGLKYDDSNDSGFLADRINPISKDQNFLKRKELNPATPKQTLSEIGTNAYDGLEYDDSNDAGFLADRINPLSKDERFKKRQQMNPIEKNKTIKEIGKNKYDGTKYDDSQDAGFLADRINPLSKDQNFLKRKELNPATPKQTVLEIGKNAYDGIKYDDSNDNGFLEERIHTLSITERFEKKKALNPINKKETVAQIGKVKDFKGPNWKLEEVVDGNPFLSDNSYYQSRTAKVTNPDGRVSTKLGPTEIGTIKGFEKPAWSDQVSAELKESEKNGLFAERVKKEDKDYHELSKDIHKQGAIEVGKIKNFDAIDYELTEDDLVGGFLKERNWYDSSLVSEEFDQGISHLLKTLPSHKLDNIGVLPTGYSTKIKWLKKLRDIIEKESKAKNVDMDDRKMRMTQLRNLREIIDALEKNEHK